jgi:hypothetical protein
MLELPMDTRTDDGYPTEEFLEWIKSYNPNDIKLSDFLSRIKENWWDGDHSFTLKKARNGYKKLEMHTCGWSGNEEIIYALRSNLYFFSMFWRETHVGGHYYFRVNVKLL